MSPEIERTTMSGLLRTLADRRGTDLHVKVGRPPMMRVQGDLVPVDGQGSMDVDAVERLIASVTGAEQRATFERDKELDFAFEVARVGRVRGNAFFQKGVPGVVFRLLPVKIPTLDDIGAPAIVKELALQKQGLLLVTGPTGSGKTTTLAAIIDHINAHLPVHIVTLEDPIEFVYEDKRAVINQREIGSDTRDFAQGLRRALRQDPDVILVGEMRDAETVSAALTAAETGHLVFGTLHTNWFCWRLSDSQPHAAECHGTTAKPERIYCKRTGMKAKFISRAPIAFSHTCIPLRLRSASTDPRPLTEPTRH